MNPELTPTAHTALHINITNEPIICRIAGRLTYVSKLRAIALESLLRDTPELSPISHYLALVWRSSNKPRNFEQWSDEENII